MACPGNQHCVSCIGTFSFPMYTTASRPGGSQEFVRMDPYRCPTVRPCGTVMVKSGDRCPGANFVYPPKYTAYFDDHSITTQSRQLRMPTRLKSFSSDW